MYAKEERLPLIEVGRSGYPLLSTSWRETVQRPSRLRGWELDAEARLEKGRLREDILVAGFLESARKPRLGLPPQLPHPSGDGRRLDEHLMSAMRRKSVGTMSGTGRASVGHIPCAGQGARATSPRMASGLDSSSASTASTSPSGARPAALPEIWVAVRNAAVAHSAPMLAVLLPPPCLDPRLLAAPCVPEFLDVLAQGTLGGMGAGVSWG